MAEKTHDTGPPATSSACPAQKDARENHNNDAGAHVNETKMANFLEKGEEILDTFVTSIGKFDAKSSQIQDLALSISEIKADLKRRNDLETFEDEPMAKQQRQQHVMQSDAESDDEEMNVITRACAEPPAESEQEPEFLDELNEFFVPEEELNPPIHDTIAELALKGLRPTNLDPEKFKKLKLKYQRPSNVDCHQIPRIDGLLWRQLKQTTKSADHAKQKIIGNLNLVAGPLLQAMDHVYGQKQPDTRVLIKCISDSFKMIGCSIATVNQERRDNIKKELTPKFKAICGDDVPVTATGLFGDNLTDQSKQLDATKDIRMTANTAVFLGKGRGEGNRYPNPSTQGRYPNSSPQGKSQYVAPKPQWKPTGQNQYPQQQQNSHQKSKKGFNSFNKGKQSQNKH